MRRGKRRKAAAAAVALLLALSVLLGLCWGSYEMSVPEVISVLFGNGTRMQNTAVLRIRLPRVLTAVFVAAGLAVSGGILQTMTKNDLADPGIIGINAGGAAAAVLFLQLQTNTYFSKSGVFSVYMLPFTAILGAFAAALLIYALSCRKELRPKRLLLMGIGINAALNALIMFFTFRGGPGEYNQVLIWTTGSLWGAGWQYVKALIPLIGAGILYMLWKAGTMDVMNFSDETAVGLGVAIGRERKKMLACAVVLAGAATAFAGNIGFLGLIAPHVARRLVGVEHKKALPLAACIAAVILLFADSVSRNLFSPIEIPAGVTVSVIGVPYFLYLMWKE